MMTIATQSEGGEKYLYKYPNIKLIKKNSEAAKKVFNKKIDILHIDADHRYESVKKDFCLFAPLVRGGHDIQSYPDDVGKFFNEIEGGRKEKVLEFYGLGFWYSGPQKLDQGIRCKIAA